MPDFRVFPLDGGDERSEISGTPTLAPPHDACRCQSANQHQPPQQPSVPAGDAVNQKQQKLGDRRCCPAERQPSPEPRTAQHGLQRTELSLQAAFHHVATSVIFARRASQPLKIISPNITASTATINQRHIFCWFSNSARCK